MWGKPRHCGWDLLRRKWCAFNCNFIHAHFLNSKICAFLKFKSIRLYINISNKAVLNMDEKVFDIQIYFLMSSIIVAAMILNTLLDCIMSKFESTENINIKIISRTKMLSLISCVLLYLSGVLPLFLKRFEVYLNESENII